MGKRHGVSFLVSLIAGGLATLIIGGAVLLPRLAFGTLELRAARERWAARPFSRYQLVVEYGESGYCRQRLDIQGDQVVALLYNTCSEPAPTVDQIFDRIERDIVRLSGRCGANGCGCDGTIVVTASYDPNLGYPRFKRVGLNAEARVWFPEYWKRRFAGDLCSHRQFGRDNITIVALNPSG